MYLGWWCIMKRVRMTKRQVRVWEKSDISYQNNFIILNALTGRIKAGN